MHRLAIVLAALALCACGRQETSTSTPESGCARLVTHDVTWSNAAAPDVITARADGPSCLQAVVTLTIRNADGDPLWVFAGTHYDLTAGGTAPENAPPVSDEDMDAFLTGWANVTEQSAGTLPEWREGAASLTESVEGFAYSTPFERDTYEMLRARDLPMLCYAAAAEASQCLVIDPLSHAPTMIVAFGP